MLFLIDCWRNWELKWSCDGLVPIARKGRGVGLIYKRWRSILGVSLRLVKRNGVTLAYWVLYFESLKSYDFIEIDFGKGVTRESCHQTCLQREDVVFFFYWNMYWCMFQFGEKKSIYILSLFNFLWNN